MSGNSNYQLTFKRREMKYLLDDAQRKRLMEAMAPYMVPDEHGPSTIRSVYYDTPALTLARRSAEHPLYREKIRERCYGEPGPESSVFVELKKKADGVVYKRRCALPMAQAETLLSGDDAPDTQIGHELSYAIKRYEGLGPQVYLAYDREAFYAADDRDFRMTYDVRVRMRWEHPSLAGPDEATQILPDGVSILEVKTTRAMPLWLVRTLDELGLAKAHWSKYGTACELRLHELEASEKSRSALQGAATPPADLGMLPGFVPHAIADADLGAATSVPTSPAVNARQPLGAIGAASESEGRDAGIRTGSKQVATNSSGPRHLRRAANEQITISL